MVIPKIQKYCIEAVEKTADGAVTDITFHMNGRKVSMLGAAGPDREKVIVRAAMSAQLTGITHAAGEKTGRQPVAFTDLDLGEEHTPRRYEDEPIPFSPGTQLPVLLGSGLGYAVQEILKALEDLPESQRVLAIVDKEHDILDASGLREKLRNASVQILWVSAPSAQEALVTLSKWQTMHGGKPFFPFLHPFYQRLDRTYYGSLLQKLESSARVDFWGKAAYPKFKSQARLLFITTKYFLSGEITAACERSGLQHKFLQLPDREMGAESFIEELLTALVSFHPDFIMTINHMGIDREGVLIDLLDKLKLPLASWFVDNPHLVLHQYSHMQSPWMHIFTWDHDNIPTLRANGFESVSYLPLGTDTHRFLPRGAEQLQTLPPDWRARVSFVGNSMYYKVRSKLENSGLPSALLNSFSETASAFGNSDIRLVDAFLQTCCPQEWLAYQQLPDIESRLLYDGLLTWEATLQYRLSCVQATLPFKPLLVGDTGWSQLLGAPGAHWRYHSELTYYNDLPFFYPLSEINFNCTSKQMKGAVNQRVFDVPACGAFLLTDWREQLGALFEPGKEVICYHSPEEATDLLEYYLRHPEKRERVALSARTRVLAEHTYDHRLRTIVDIMRQLYGN